MAKIDQKVRENHLKAVTDAQNTLKSKYKTFETEQDAITYADQCKAEDPDTQVTIWTNDKIWSAVDIPGMQVAELAGYYETYDPHWDPKEREFHLNQVKRNHE